MVSLFRHHYGNGGSSIAVSGWSSDRGGSSSADWPAWASAPIRSGHLQREICLQPAPVQLPGESNCSSYRQTSAIHCHGPALNRVSVLIIEGTVCNIRSNQVPPLPTKISAEPQIFNAGQLLAA